MKLQNWLELVIQNSNEIREAVIQFHPLIVSFNPEEFPITSPQAESACQLVRKEIVKEVNSTNILDIYDQIISDLKTDKNLRSEDLGILNSIFNQTWFGAPESRQVYKYPGFSLICDLLSDPIEESIEDGTTN